MSNFKFIKTASVFLVLAFILGGFLSGANVIAQTDSNESQSGFKTKESFFNKNNVIQINEVKIEVNGNNMEVDAVLFNKSLTAKTQSFTYLVLLENINPLTPSKKSEDDSVPIIVSAVEGNDFISLKSQEEKKVHYSLPVTPHLPNDNYRLSIRLILPDGEKLGVYSSVVSDFGANKSDNKTYQEAFLDFNQGSCVILATDGRKFTPNSGPVFESLESPRVQCLVKNVGKEAVTVSPKIEWKELYVYGHPSGDQKKTESSEKVFSFASGETKLIEINLPKPEKSQVYQAFWSFAGREGLARSFNMPFRWTIRGQSGRIEQVSLVSPLKKVYKKGETISFSVDYYGSMDLFWAGRGDDNNSSSLEQNKMLVTVKDAQGNICGQNNVSLLKISDENIKNKKADILLERNCKEIFYNVSLSSEDKEIAKQSGEIPKVTKEINDVMGGVYLIMEILALLVIALLIFLFIRKKKNLTKNLSSFLLFFFISLSFFAVSGSVLAGHGVPKYYTGSKDDSNLGGFSTSTSNILYSMHGTVGNDYFRVKGADGNDSIMVRFNGMSEPWVGVTFRSGLASCGNQELHVKFNIYVVADGMAQKEVGFRLDGETGAYENGGKTNGYGWADIANSNEYIFFDPDPSSIGNFYDSAKKLKTKPYLIIRISSSSSTWANGVTGFSRGDFGGTDNTVYGTRETAFGHSDYMEYKIPLNLPDPSVDLSLASISGASPINYNCKPTLDWTVKDVDSCSASSASGGWSGTKSAIDGTHSQTMTSGITASTNYGLSCNANLGSGVGTGTYSDSVSVGVKAKPNVKSFFVNNGLDFKKGDSFYLKGTIENITDTIENIADLSACKITGPNNYTHTLNSSTDSPYTWSVGSITYTTQITNADERMVGTYTLSCVNADSCNYTTSDAATATCFDCGTQSRSSSSSSSSSSSYGLTVKKFGIKDGVTSEDKTVGTITSDPTGINCGSSCSTSSHNFAQGTDVTLTAKENGNYVFSEWTDDSGVDSCDSGSGSECIITMNEPKTVRAYFKYTTGFTLTVTKEGDGAETSVVTTSSNQPDASEVDCGTNCVGSSYNNGTIVVLTAQSDTDNGVSFVSWSGVVCTNGVYDDETNCTVKMDASYTVKATFKTDLSVVADCYANGSAAVGDEVTFTAEPNEGGESYSWSGEGLSNSDSSVTKIYTYTTSGTKTATVAVTSNGKTVSKSCEVEITSSCTGSCDDSYSKTLTVNLGDGSANSGNGMVTATAVGEEDFVCEDNATCEREYSQDTSVKLEADAYSPGGSFTGWSGCDSSSGATCYVTMSTSKGVTATFTNLTYNLKVIFEGTGSGYVYNNIADDSTSGGTTWFDYMSGDSVSLTATPTDGNFGGWNNSSGGNCTNTDGSPGVKSTRDTTDDTCSITLATNKELTVDFSATSYNCDTGTGACSLVSGSGGEYPDIGACQSVCESSSSPSSESASSRPDVIIKEM